MVRRTMRFTNLTREIGIGANSYLLELGGKRVVLDAGCHPKKDGPDSTPDYARLPAEGIDAVLVSHAHQDHVGALPVLTAAHAKVPVFLTGATAELADAMLHNSVNVMRRKSADLGSADLQLFTHRGVDLSAAQWRTVGLNRARNFSGDPSSDAGEATFEFFDAGHILGSAGVLLEADGWRLFYTGDVNFSDQSLLPGAAMPEGPLDVLVMETTRGDSAIPPGFTRRAEEERFGVALDEALGCGGCVLIPVFALGKTQEVLTLLHRLQAGGKLRLPPVYIGGLSTRMTGVYDKYRRSTPRLLPNLELFDALAPFTLAGKSVASARVDKRHIYALSSGMMTEKTPSNTFAQQVIENPASTIFFVGYTDPDSPAGRLRAAGPGGTVQLDSAKPPAKIRCRIEDFTFSAHSSRDELVAFAVRCAPKKIVLVHGDPLAIEWFRTTLDRELPATEILVPEPGCPCDLA